MKQLHFPEDTIKLIGFIEHHGFDTYLVGGAVRDALLGRPTSDFDFATQATPEDLEHIFSGFQVQTHGLKHGTLRVVTPSNHYEITTFRSDMDYPDHRRPSGVVFIKSLEEDLLRRDFTLNALAYHPDRGLIDYVGGEKDLEERILRTVGDPHLRFEEDALRIMRGMRLQAELKLRVDEETKRAMIDKRDLLFLIARERIYEELKRILKAPYFYETLRDFHEIFKEIMPELQDHQYFEEVIKASEFSPQDISVRLAMLFSSFSNDLTHNDTLLRKSLSRLKADNKTTLESSRLVGYFHEPLTPNKRELSAQLHQMGQEMLLKLIDLRDAFYQGLALEEEHQDLLDFYSLLHHHLDGELVFERSRLAITGDDLLAIGYPRNASIRMALDVLLNEVIEDTLDNTPDALIKRAKELL